MHESIIIIGAGPAGAAAAIQLKRYGFDPLMLEAERVGGLLYNAGWVENYPGFAEGIGGPDLAALLKDHLNRWAVRLKYETVEELEKAGDGYRIRTDRNVYFTPQVVIASGTRPISVQGIDLPAAAAERIFYEVYPLLKLRSRRVAIVGGGDAAFDYALNLAAVNEVMILQRGQEARALPLLQRRVSEEPAITLKQKAKLETVRMLDGRLELGILEPEGRKSTPADYLIFAIGREARLDFLVYNLVYRKNDANGLHFCGDVVNGRFRQAAISAGDGLRVAMNVAAKLTEGKTIGSVEM